MQTSSEPKRAAGTRTLDQARPDLVERARAGQHAAREELALRYRQPAFTLALQLLGNREDALDVAQDAMLRFFSTLDRFDGRRPVLPWLQRIVRNRAFDLMRRGRVRAADSMDSDGPEGGSMEIEGGLENPEDQVERRMLRTRIWRALAEIDPPHREILVLRDYQDLSYREMAELLEIPLGTVMSRLHQARRRLQAVLLRSGGLERAHVPARSRDGIVSEL